MSNTKKVSLDEINSDAFIERLKANDEQAFSDLFSCIVPRLCWFLSKFELGEADAEEIAADTMVKVNKSIGKFNPQSGAKLSTWVFRVAENTAIDYKRKEKKQSESRPLDDAVSKQVDRKAARQWFRESSPAGRIKNPTAASPEVKKMINALNALSDEDKHLLLMRQNMEYEEIAIVEEASAPTLRTRYSRALARLRNELEKG